MAGSHPGRPRAPTPTRICPCSHPPRKPHSNGDKICIAFPAHRALLVLSSAKAAPDRWRKVRAGQRHTVGRVETQAGFSDCELWSLSVCRLQPRCGCPPPAQGPGLHPDSHACEERHLEVLELPSLQWRGSAGGAGRWGPSVLRRCCRSAHACTPPPPQPRGAACPRPGSAPRGPADTSPGAESLLSTKKQQPLTHIRLVFDRESDSFPAFRVQWG